MSDNHGTAGDIFIQKLMAIGEEGVRAMIAEATDKFHSRYGVAFKGEERYWQQVLVLTDLALRLAKEWGIVSFSSEPCMQWAVDQIGTLRKTVSENQIDAFDLISEYLNEFAGDTVRVMHTGKQKPMVDYERMPRHGIRARVDVHRKVSSDPFDSGTLMLDRAHFRKWLSARGGDYKGVTDTLAASGELLRVRWAAVLRASFSALRTFLLKFLISMGVPLAVRFHSFTSCSILRRWFLSPLSHACLNSVVIDR